MDTNKVTPEFNSQSGKPFDYYVDISSLHATQLRVGYSEIEQKRRDFADKAAKGKLQAYLESKPVIVVFGPPGMTNTKPFPSLMEMAANIDKQNKGKNKTAKAPLLLPPADYDGEATVWVVDHHHSTIAVHRAGGTTVPIEMLHDYSNLTEQKFWQKMWDDDLLNLNNDGPDGSFDDPFRSLAREVRKAGGYEKADTLYEEFQWANFFRDKIDAKLMDDFAKVIEKGGDLTKCEAVRQAVVFAKSEQAKDLPGYKGPQQQQASSISSAKATGKKPEKNAKPPQSASKRN